MYSATKHIDGHGRVMGGAILGKKKYCDEIIKPFIRNTGHLLVHSMRGYLLNL